MLKPPRGMRDFPPEEQIIRQRVFEEIREVFELYGFDPMETPAVESWKVLSAKEGGGEEIIKEIYYFKDKAGRELGLRFDLTVPLARYVASKPNLPKPFKRYQISRVWRYDEPQRGRYREFWQADIDTVGSESMGADAEVLACAVDALRRLGFKEFKIRMNNRKILDDILGKLNIGKEALIVIDKLDKIGEEGVRKELSRTGVSEEKVDALMEMLKERELERFERLGDRAREGVREIREIVDLLDCYGCSNYVCFDPSLVRGLAYYTGPIFEVWSEEYNKALAGGGRYDNLIGIFSGRDVPATGISLGVERIIELMKEKGLVARARTKTVVFVAGKQKESIKIAKSLREEGIKAQVDLMGRKLKRQLQYANSKGIRYVLFVGLKEGLKLRDMETGEEKVMDLDEIISFLKGVSDE